jgi:predicted RNA binding protein YcfA (HicA-like mRNA interferase family)
MFWRNVVAIKDVSQLLKILRGTSDSNIPFEQLCQLLINMGFEKRTRGSHHIFTKEGVEEILNIQPNGNKAKAYQIKQIFLPA